MILASASPRRQELLAREGITFEVMPADIDESRRVGESPRALVERLANEKARACQRMHPGIDDIILAADTIVWRGNVVLGKPADDAMARRMLESLSDATHHVTTGVAIIAGNTCTSFTETTDVTFRDVTDNEITAYVASGECADKAGAYAIQGGAANFVDHIDGDYDNVVGLPVKRVLAALEDLGTSR